MTDTFDASDADGGDVLDPNIRAQLKRTQELEKTALEANARAEAAERKAAFAEVGIPTTGVGKLFRDSYKGDLDPEAVKQSAEEYGILGQETGSRDEGITEEERAAYRAVAGAGSGVPPAGQDPALVAMAQIREAKSQQEVMEIIRRTEAEHPEIGRFTSPD